MKVLVACEMSGRVRAALRQQGVEAWSADVLPAMDESPYHIQGDVRDILSEGWGAIIAFPPCTHLAVSSARYFKQKQHLQAEALDFVRLFLDHPTASYVCVENPVGIISSRIRKPDQIIQPYQFGHPESKKTCLWLRDLPLLRPTKVLPLPASGRWDNQTPSGQNKLGPSPKRALLRGLTYPGIAQAMADQWAPLFRG